LEALEGLETACVAGAPADAEAAGDPAGFAETAGDPAGFALSPGAVVLAAVFC
jgi:hypothetical protein